MSCQRRDSNHTVKRSGMQQCIDWEVGTMTTWKVNCGLCGESGSHCIHWRRHFESLFISCSRQLVTGSHIAGLGVLSAKNQRYFINHVACADRCSQGRRLLTWKYTNQPLISGCYSGCRLAIVEQGWKCLANGMYSGKNCATMTKRAKKFREGRWLRSFFYCHRDQKWAEMIEDRWALHLL